MSYNYDRCNYERQQHIDAAMRAARDRFRGITLSTLAFAEEQHQTALRVLADSFFVSLLRGRWPLREFSDFALVPDMYLWDGKLRCTEGEPRRGLHDDVPTRRKGRRWPNR